MKHRVADSQSKHLAMRDSTTKHRITQIVVDLVLIAVIGAIFLIVYLIVDPKIKYFYCNDTDLFYPYIADTVPFWAVGIFGVLGPLLIILIVEVLNLFAATDSPVPRSKPKTFFIHFFHAVSLFALGIVITLVLTEIGKRWIGRLRPHFMSVCKPDYSKFYCTSAGLTGVVYNPIYSGDICTGEASAIKEARFSVSAFVSLPFRATCFNHFFCFS